ncbi:crossover junction endodeoxyribonuclease RuvC [candidate division TA06 bacterium]|nr:crossover junction endodeoxyribonuclease RuvC [candidate division TA06 bacterium]
MVIMGVDPGLKGIGFGLIEGSKKRARLIRFGRVELPSAPTFPPLLQTVYHKIRRLIQTYHPEVYAIETLFYNKDAKGAILLGHVRGVLLLAAADSGLSIVEYSPLEIKKSVVGRGMASKEQVQFMVKSLLQMSELPEPLDASDALACALCYLNKPTKT